MFEIVLVASSMCGVLDWSLLGPAPAKACGNPACNCVNCDCAPCLCGGKAMQVAYQPPPPAAPAVCPCCGQPHPVAAKKAAGPKGGGTIEIEIEGYIPYPDAEPIPGLTKFNVLPPLSHADLPPGTVIQTQIPRGPDGQPMPESFYKPTNVPYVPFGSNTVTFPPGYTGQRTPLVPRR
jgi:hypothetical protein